MENFSSTFLANFIRLSVSCGRFADLTGIFNFIWFILFCAQNFPPTLYAPFNHHIVLFFSRWVIGQQTKGKWGEGNWWRNYMLYYYCNVLFSDTWFEFRKFRCENMSKSRWEKFFFLAKLSRCVGVCVCVWWKWKWRWLLKCYR